VLFRSACALIGENFGMLWWYGRHLVGRSVEGPHHGDLALVQDGAEPAFGELLQPF